MHSRKKLAVIGASYLQLPLVQRAQAMGVDTVCFAWAEGAVCKDYCSRFYPISIVEKEPILKAAAEEEIDGIVTIASDVGVPTVSYVAHRLRLTGNSEESAFLSTNKFQMRQTLAAAGLNCPQFFRVDASHPLQADQRSHLRFPVMVKPVDRSGSMGVRRVGDVAALEDALSVAQEKSLTGAAIVEAFVEGVEVSVESISWQGRHCILAITDKVTSGPPHFVELAHHQPSQIPDPIQQEIRRQTCLGLDALQIEFGASHAEFLITPAGEVVVTEIAGRMGGDFIGADLVRLSTGYDFLQAVIEVALGAFSGLPEAIPHVAHSGVYFYSQATPEIGALIRNRARFPQCVRAELLDQEVKELRQSSDRGGYFLYQAAARFQPDAAPIRIESVVTR